MHEEVKLDKSQNKADVYEQLIPQLEALVLGESNSIANVANIMAVLKYEMGFFWVGCYFIDDSELVLGPFQGPLACARIRKGKGVCGTSWEKGEVIIVPDVDMYDGHIACSVETKSEIVIPMYKSGSFIGVLDVDSEEHDSFNETDAQYLSKIADLISSVYVN